MLLLKKIDVYGQMVVIIGNFLFALAFQNINAFYGYFIVGGWQVVSAFLNFIFAQKFPLALHRRHYNFIIAIIAIVALISIIIKTVLFGLLFCLLFFSPLVAIWYNYIGYRELKNWEARELVHFR